MREILVQDFEKAVAVSSGNALAVNAGKFSRAAIMAVFQLNGGIEAFAIWAEAHPSDYYTKLFPKLISREAPETNKADDVEDLLTILDGEAKDVTEEPEGVDIKAPVRNSNIGERLAQKASGYADAERGQEA